VLLYTENIKTIFILMDSSYYYIPIIFIKQYWLILHYRYLYTFLLLYTQDNVLNAINIGIQINVIKVLRLDPVSL
jgi:hypothetical protein